MVVGISLECASSLFDVLRLTIYANDLFKRFLYTNFDAYVDLSLS